MTATTDSAILTVNGLNARIAGQQVVEDVSFSVASTGVTALLGRNGVGKTSTIKGILGLIERKGEVLFDGARIDRMRTHKIVQRGIGYVPEDREVFSELTVLDNLRLAERQSNPRRAFVDELFPDLVARRTQLAGTLSGGQQQMLSLGRALINDNRLLLVDEPTKGLAPIIVQQVADVLAEAARTVPILLVEQNLTVVRQLAKDVIVLDGGRVVHTGDAQELLNDEALVHKFLGVHSGDETEAPQASTAPASPSKKGSASVNEKKRA